MDQATMGISFTATNEGVTMVVSTVENGAIFTLNMDPEFAIGACQSLVHALALMGNVDG